MSSGETSLKMGYFRWKMRMCQPCRDLGKDGKGKQSNPKGKRPEVEERLDHLRNRKKDHSSGGNSGIRLG
jgi:hypothetical protein